MKTVKRKTSSQFMSTKHERLQLMLNKNDSGLSRDKVSSSLSISTSIQHLVNPKHLLEQGKYDLGLSLALVEHCDSDE